MHPSEKLLNLLYYIIIANLPEYYNDTIENVEAVADVAKWSLCDDFEEHLESKHSREYYVAQLYDLSQFVGLGKGIMIKIYVINKSLLNFDTK